MTTIVRFLLNTGADPNIYYYHGNSPLTHAAHGDYPEAKAFMEGDAEKSMETRNGQNNFCAQTHAKCRAHGKASIVRLTFEDANKEVHEDVTRHEEVVNLPSAHPDDEEQ